MGGIEMRWRRLTVWRWVAQFLVGALTFQWTGLAAAQVFEEEVKPPPIPKVVVLDFEVPKDLPEIWGRKAADAVALAMAETGRYEVASRAEVEAAKQRLKLVPPLHPNQFSLLAGELKARTIVYGKIVKVIIDEKAWQAGVQLQMLCHDRYLDVPVNGAHVLAMTPPRPGVTPDILVDHALSLAASQAVQQLMTTRLPEGQIIQRVGKSVIINRGSDQGIRNGMQMWVYRLVRDPETGLMVRKRIGLIEITSAEARQSSAVIREELVPLQYPDRVIGVYEIPRLGVTEPPVRTRAKGIGSALPSFLLLVAGVLIVGSLAGGSKKGSEVPSVGPAMVVDNGRRIKIHLGTPKDCVAVEIYRDTSPSFAALLPNLIDIVEGQTTKEYYDSDIAYNGTATIEIDTDTPTNRLPSLARSYTAGVGTGEGDVTEEPFNYEKPFNHTPIQPGLHYWYVIRRITARRLPPPPPTGGQETTGAREPFELVYSPPSRPIGPLTPLVELSAADLIEPTGDVNIRSVTFKFRSVQGADEYIVQVSDNPSFPNNRTVQIPLPYKLPNPDLGGQLLIIENQDLSGRFGTAQTLYWRVGYRYSKDINPPEGGWVFSQVRSFRVPITPPSPPG